MKTILFLAGSACGMMLIIAHSFFYPAQPIIPEPIVHRTTEFRYLDKPVLPKSKTFETILYLQPDLDPSIAETIARYVDLSSTKYFLPPSLVLSLIKRESRFDPLATSKVGAIGLMQILAKWHPEKVRTGSLYRIENNIDIGCQILSEYLSKNDWDIKKTLHCYLGKNAKKGHLEKYVMDILTTNLEIALFQLTLPTHYEEVKGNG
jgi:hypothetical protein